MNSLNFYLLENVFISSSILKSVSAECSIQHSDIIALNFGLLCFVEILCHFNYFSFEEKLFSVLRFSLCWVYDLYGVIFFSTSSLGVWRDSYICYLISLINLKKFSAIISFNIVSASFLSPLSWDSNYICQAFLMDHLLLLLHFILFDSPRNLDISPQLCLICH